MPVQKTCEVCGKEFTASNARAETAKTCSQACRGVLIARAYSSKRVNRECLKCGAPISVSVGRAERGNGLYCGKACKNLSLIGRGFIDLSADGSKTETTTGYVYERVRNHPFASCGKVFQHRLVMESLLAMSNPAHCFLVAINGKQYLKPGIDVHHKNEVKNDNSPSNLIACTKAAHKDMHAGRPVMAGETWPETGDEIAASPRAYHRTCEQCGTGFVLKKSTVERSAGKFCSMTCLRAKQGESGLPATINKPCEMCGKEFVAKRWQVLLGRGRYCSDPCRIKFLATTHKRK